MTMIKKLAITMISTAVIGIASAGEFKTDFAAAQAEAARDKKSMLVIFTGSDWCPPCKAEMPSMEELYSNYGTGKFEILAVNVDDDGPEVMPGFLQEHPHSFPIVFDTDFQARTLYGVSMFPVTFIVDQKGVIAKKIIGAIDWTSPQMLSYLNALMGDS